VWTARQEAILDGAEPIRDRIRQVLMTVVDEETAAREDGRRGCLAVNTAIELAGVDDQVTAQVRHTFDRVEEALHGALSRARRDGAISGEPRALARFVLNSLYGLRVLGKTADRAALVGIVETTLSVL
jgi:TetR/AcrR family transcriptional repressor of nem operon